MSLTAFILPGIGHKYSAFYGPNTKVRAISAEKFAVLLPRFKEGGEKKKSSIKSSGNHNSPNLLPAVFAGLALCADVRLCGQDVFNAVGVHPAELLSEVPPVARRPRSGV